MHGLNFVNLPNSAELNFHAKKTDCFFAQKKSALQLRHAYAEGKYLSHATLPFSSNICVHFSPIDHIPSFPLPTLRACDMTRAHLLL